MKSTRHFLLLFTGCFLVAQLTACTKSKDSTIKISTQSMQAMTADTGLSLMHVVVNVRGPGMPVVNYIWSGRAGDDQVVTPPPYFEIHVPSGSDRLIQYLGVFGDSSDAMQFYYGDLVKGIAPGDVPVEISAFKFGGLAYEKKLKGRYLRADGTAPTGKVEMLFAPPGGKPVMFIEDEFVYGGWMNLMLFEGVPLSYRMKTTGEYLFKDLKAENVTFNSARAKVVFPEFWHGWMEGGLSQCSTSSNRASEIFIGYFGPGSSGNNLYYDSVTPSWGLYGDSGCGTAIGWASPPTGTNAGVAEGGSSVCPSVGTPFCIGAESFQYGTHDGYATGPFKNQAGWPVLVNYNEFGVITGFDWKILPGSDAMLRNFVIFSRPPVANYHDSHRDDEQMAVVGCAKYLVNEGYSQIGSVSKNAGGLLSYSIAPTDTMLDGRDHHDFAICPLFNTPEGTVVAGSDFAGSQGHGPVAQITQGPVVTNAASLSISVSNVSKYKYYVVNGSACGGGTYSAEIDQGVNPSFTVTHSANGFYTVCVLGGDVNGNWQDLSSPSTASWEYDTAAPFITSCTFAVDGVDPSIVRYVLNFNESMNGGVEPIITQTGGAAVTFDFTPGWTPTSYQFSITPNQTITFEAKSAKDLAGNVMAPVVPTCGP